MTSFNKIEAEIKEILITHKRGWVRLYELISEVENQQLWKEKHHSLTAWVRHLAEVAKVSESLIWKRKKAGEVYADYQKRAQEKGSIVPNIEQVEVSPDNLELVEKISQGNLEIKDGLMEKVLQGDLKRSDLKNAWQTARDLREEQGLRPARKSRHEKIQPVAAPTLKTSVASAEDELSEEAFEGISASDIVMALSYSTWLKGSSDYFNPTSNKKGRRIYKTLPEFPVYTGTSRYSRRVDLVILENYTHREAFDLNIHAIEIKTSKHDLLQDQKMSEYADFCNHMWLAVPGPLAETAEEVILDSWGIITITNGIATVFRKAVYKETQRKIEVFQTALLKTL